MIKYHPVVIHTTEARPAARDLALAGVDRFERLNGIRPQFLTADIMDAAGATPSSKFWYPMWVWDLVPDSAEYILVMDSKILPIKPLPPIPEVVFAAVSDRRDRVNQGVPQFEVLRRTRRLFQPMVFIAHRSTREAFEATKKYNYVERWYKDNGGTGRDGRYYMVPFNAEIQSRYSVTWLPKTWNWIMMYDKEDYIPDAHLINMHCEGTWYHWRYVLRLIDKLEALGGTP
jgi:hypothetical protein